MAFRKIVTDFGTLTIWTLPKFMNTAPQAVTDRYVTNLINYGRNREFDIKTISQYDNIVDENEHVGVYWRARILPINVEDTGANARIGAGATISQAVRNALIKHGVTFR